MTIFTLTLQACSISLLAFSSALYRFGSCTLKNFKAPSKSACKRSSLEVCNGTHWRTIVSTIYCGNDGQMIVSKLVFFLLFMPIKVFSIKIKLLKSTESHWLHCGLNLSSIVYFPNRMYVRTAIFWGKNYYLKVRGYSEKITEALALTNWCTYSSISENQSLRSLTRQTLANKKKGGALNW